MFVFTICYGYWWHTAGSDYIYMGYFFDSILNPPDPKIDQLSISSWWESGWGGNYLFVHSQVETLFFFLHSEIHCNLRLHSGGWWRGHLQWRRRYSRRNSYWRGLDGRTCSKDWPVWNVAIKLCGENIIIQGSSSTLPLDKRWLHDYET